MQTDDMSEASADWDRHPFTQKTATAFAKRAAGALQQLMNAAVNSTDPAVRGAYTRYIAIEEVVAYIRKPWTQRSDP